MKRNILLTLLTVMGMNAWAQQLAFPGAEGFGRFTTGGRGGVVRHVTTLVDDGKTSTVGTLRWAVNGSAKKTVVFDVSGTIHLKSALKFGQNTTVAGQTAPGDGICIADYPVTVASNNIVRFVRFRLGNVALQSNPSAHEGDGLGGMDAQNIIIDHCSVSWSIDECLSVYGSKNITVQWCIASQSLVNSGHSKGAHGYGGNWGGSGASYHHNLIAHHTSRTPRLGPRPGTQTDERMDLRNNVIYNWAGEGCYGGEGMNVNIVNNYYKPGPGTLKLSTNKQKRIANIGIRTSDYTKHDTATPNDWDKMWHVWGKFYITGNVNPNHSDVTADNWTYGVYNQITNSKVDNTFTQATKDTMRIDTPIAYEEVTTHTAEKAFEQVLAYAGACLHRDAVDELIINDTRNGLASYSGKAGPGFIDSQDDIKAAIPGDESPWPTLLQTAVLTDTDGDGMPDEWENANGLDPNNANDGSTVGNDGYTNLERYMNSLVADIMEKENQGGTPMSGQQTTAIEAVAVQVTATRHPGIYDLQGRQLSETMQPSKGIYIVDGRKVVLK